MQRFFLLVFVLFSTLSLTAQNKWTILAGGTPDSDTPDPYFSPGQLVIEVGDTVVWNNIQGWHDITTTSGPEDFSYGPAGSGWTHQFVFTQAGVYDYECSVGSHALTQFGTITVVEEQTKYTIVAGGTPDSDTPDPYFSPNQLTIQAGDTVVWNNIQGWHDITTTSGPEDFSYDPAGSGWTHQFIFTQVGVYDYECSVGSHALTQFGTINVEQGTISSVENLAATVFQHSVHPNPASNTVQIRWTEDHTASTKDVYLVIYDFLGAEKARFLVPARQNHYEADLSGMPKGTYIVSLNKGNKRLWSSKLVRI